jgi:hypothetical protein
MQARTYDHDPLSGTTKVGPIRWGRATAVLPGGAGPSEPGQSSSTGAPRFWLPAGFHKRLESATKSTERSSFQKSTAFVTWAYLPGRQRPRHPTTAPEQIAEGSLFVKRPPVRLLGSLDNSRGAWLSGIARAILGRDREGAAFAPRSSLSSITPTLLVLPPLLSSFGIDPQAGRCDPVRRPKPSGSRLALARESRTPTPRDSR